MKAKQDDFAEKLKEARAELLEPSARDLVLGILRSDLDAILGRYVASHRQEVVAAFETWWDKYRVTLTTIEEERTRRRRNCGGFAGAWVCLNGTTGAGSR